MPPGVWSPEKRAFLLLLQVVVVLYARDRLNQTRSAKEERTVNTQFGYLGEIVHFVGSQIGDGEKKDRWDFFRHPNHHLPFTQKLQQSRNQPSGNDNYRKVMASVCSWSSKEGSEFLAARFFQSRFAAFRATRRKGG